MPASMLENTYYIVMIVTATIGTLLTMTIALINSIKKLSKLETQVVDMQKGSESRQKDHADIHKTIEAQFNDGYKEFEAIKSKMFSIENSIGSLTNQFTTYQQSYTENIDVLKKLLQTNQESNIKIALIQKDTKEIPEIHKKLTNVDGIVKLHEFRIKNLEIKKDNG